MARKQVEAGAPATPAEPQATALASWRDGVRTVTVLTPAEAALIFERWGVDPVITEDLTGAAPPTMAQDRIDEIRAVAERPQPYPYPGAKPAGLYSQEPFPPLPELLVRFERRRLISPAYPWWARGFRALIVRYGETPVILIACCMIVAFFFGRTVWSLTYGPAA